MNVREVEVLRMLKLCNDYVEPISFRVPRVRVSECDITLKKNFLKKNNFLKSFVICLFVLLHQMEYFQDDIYGMTRQTAAPTMTSSEWLAGTNKGSFQTQFFSVTSQLFFFGCKDPVMVSLRPSDMKLLSEAPQETESSKMCI